MAKNSNANADSNDNPVDSLPIEEQNPDSVAAGFTDIKKMLEHLLSTVVYTDVFVEFGQQVINRLDRLEDLLSAGAKARQDNPDVELSLDELIASGEVVDWDQGPDWLQVAGLDSINVWEKVDLKIICLVDGSVVICPSLGRKVPFEFLQLLNENNIDVRLKGNYYIAG